LYHKKKEFNPAVKDFTKTIELDKNFYDAYNNRAIIYHYELKEYQKALNDYNFLKDNNAGDDDLEDEINNVLNLLNN
jgi:tetratricopeptide (TPR) repeat protein